VVDIEDVDARAGWGVIGGSDLEAELCYCPGCKWLAALEFPMVFEEGLDGKGLPGKQAN
jgi:hypothetical protein